MRTVEDACPYRRQTEWRTVEDASPYQRQTEWRTVENACSYRGLQAHSRQQKYKKTGGASPSPTAETECGQSMQTSSTVRRSVYFIKRIRVLSRQQSLSDDCGNPRSPLLSPLPPEQNNATFAAEALRAFPQPLCL